MANEKQVGDSQLESQESEQRHHRLLDLLPIALYTCEAPSGTISYYNELAAELWGRRPEVGDTDERFCGAFRLWRTDGTHLPHDQTPMARALRDGEEFRDEEVIIEHPDGRRVQVVVNISPLYDDAGRVIGAINAFQDVSTRRAAERALHESEERFASFMQHLPGLAWIKDTDGRYVYANSAAERAFQKQLDELQGKTDDEVFPVETAARFKENDRKAIETNSGVQEVETLLHDDGELHYSLVNKFPIPDPDGKPVLIGGMAIDITQRMKAEQALRESEQRLRVMANVTPAMIWTAAADGTITWSSDRWFEYCGITRENFNRDWPTAIHPDDIDQCLVTWHAALKSGNDYEFEFRVRRRDGEYRWFVSRATPVRDTAGRISEWIGATTDIHDGRLVDEEHAFLAAVVESTQDAVVTKTLDGVIRSWNAGAEVIFGYTADEATGRSIRLIVPSELWDEELGILDRLRRGERIEHFETTRTRKDGRRIDISLTVSPIHDQSGRIIGASKVARDITHRKRMEAELLAKESELDLVTNTTPLILARCSRDWRYLYVNRAASEYFGRTPEELIGRRIEDMMGPEAFAIVKPRIERVLQGEKVEYEAEIPYAVVGRRWLHINYLPNRDETGEVVGWVASIFDITARKRAEEALRESEDRFRMMADNIAQLAWICDEVGDAVWYNKRWYDYTGTTYEEMRGWGWKAVHHPDHLNRVVERIKHCFETGTPWEDTFPLRGTDGNYRWFLSRAFPIRDDNGNVVHWFGTNTDITQQLEAEERLREADRRKDEFLAMLAHELRNPLAPIRTGLELIRLLKDDPDRMEETRRMMERQTRQLIALVDDLLDVSRITRQKLELRKCRILLADAVSSAVEASRPFIDEAGHGLEVSLPDRPLFVHADPNRLAQVISNLLNNAAKYTPEGGLIELSVEQQGNQAVIAVRDNGIGIPSEQLHKIFEMFAQIDRPQERGYTGLGIGLTLVKWLVEMHAGHVEVESQGENQGSTFWVRLPLLTAHVVDTDSSPTNDAPQANARHRVLVVDDNRPAAEMLSIVVKMLGNEVRTAKDGVEAVEAAAEFRPDIVLMDIGMPRMNGYEAAEAIRQQPWGKEMMLVALTGWGQDDDKRKSRAAGFEHHLVKPAEPSDLHEIFAKLEQRDLRSTSSLPHPFSNRD